MINPPDVCCPSELDQSAAETLGSSAGFPNSFQTTTLCVSSATVCRFVFAASGRRLVQLPPPSCLCWGLLDASRLPSVSSSRKCLGRVRLQRRAGCELPSSPVFFTRDGLLFMGEPSSPLPPEERQSSAAVHGGQL